jgi:hypothetical protein
LYVFFNGNDEKAGKLASSSFLGHDFENNWRIFAAIWRRQWELAFHIV